MQQKWAYKNLVTMTTYYRVELPAVISCKKGATWLTKSVKTRYKTAIDLN